MASLSHFSYSTHNHWNVLRAGRSLMVTIERWVPSICGEGNDATLPHFPQDIANELLIERLASADRLLNRQQGWNCHTQTHGPRFWNKELKLAHVWIAGIVGDWIKRWDLREIVDLENARQTVRNLDFQDEEDSLFSLGDRRITVEIAEFKALSKALNYLECELNEIGDSTTLGPTSRHYEGGNDVVLPSELVPITHEGFRKIAPRAGSHKLKPCELKAKQSCDYAIEQSPELKDAPFKTVYKWLISNSCYIYDDDFLPKFKTWDAHRRKASQKLGESPRHTSRSGRETGKSIVRQDAI